MTIQAKLTVDTSDPDYTKQITAEFERRLRAMVDDPDRVRVKLEHTMMDEQCVLTAATEQSVANSQLNSGLHALAQAVRMTVETDEIAKVDGYVDGSNGEQRLLAYLDDQGHATYDMWAMVKTVQNGKSV